MGHRVHLVGTDGAVLMRLEYASAFRASAAHQTIRDDLKAGRERIRLIAEQPGETDTEISRAQVAGSQLLLDLEADRYAE